MREDKIKEKYPNINSEEEYRKLCKILERKKKLSNLMVSFIALFIVSVFAAVLSELIGGVILFTFPASLALLIIYAIQSSKFDNENKAFLSVARHKKVLKRNVLDRKVIMKKVNGFYIGESLLDIFKCIAIGVTSLVIGLVTFGIINHGEEIPLGAVMILCVSAMAIYFIAMRIYTYIKRKSVKGEEYVLLHTKILSKHIEYDSDSDSTVEYCKFVFDCAEYGMLESGASDGRYYTASVGEDEYYLVLIKKLFSSKKYQIVGIFSTEEYELDPALEQSVRTI